MTEKKTTRHAGWGLAVCYPDGEPSLAENPEPVDLWTVDELRDTSFVGTEIRFHHNPDVPVVGHIAYEKTDAQTGKKTVLIWLPPGTPASLLAQELVLSGAITDVSLTHKQRLLMDDLTEDR